MAEKIQDYIILKTGNHELAYIVACIVYLLLTFGGLFLIGYIFGFWWQTLLISILMSIMRMFTMGFHAHKNWRCFLISAISITVCAILTHYMPIWAVFALCMYSCVDIYKKAPIELNNDFESKDKDWHFKGAIICMVIYLVISLVSYYFKLYDLSNCFSLSICLVDLLLFKNEKEFI